MYATQTALTVLLKHEVGNGTGQMIDVSLLDRQAAWLTYQASNYFATGESPGRLWSEHPTIAPYEAFETADGYVVVAIASGHTWPRFCEAVERPTDAWLDRFATLEVPANDVNSIADVFSHLQVRAPGMHVSIEHPTAGEVEIPWSPMHFSRTPATIRRHPPCLGEHTEEVLGEHGYDAEIVAALYVEASLATHPTTGVCGRSDIRIDSA